MKFEKAVRRQAKLRLALTSPSGGGKTYGALLIAKGLGGKIAVIDTEHKSASLYAGAAGMPEFDALNLTPPYTPERFIEALHLAEAAGYDTAIFDSITHEWNGSGGCLEINDLLAAAKYRGNTWSAWNETTPRHRKFIDAILRSPLNIIATMRSKTETVQGDDKKVKKLGMKSEQRDGSDYEFTTVLDIVHDGHFAVASKDRTGLFSDKDPTKITVKTGQKLLAWLQSGEAAAEDTSATTTETGGNDTGAGMEIAPISDEVRLDFLADIEEAKTVDALRIAYAEAKAAAESRVDLAAFKAFKKAKDDRLASLTLKQEETA